MGRNRHARQSQHASPPLPAALSPGKESGTAMFQKRLWPRLVAGLVFAGVVAVAVWWLVTQSWTGTAGAQPQGQFAADRFPQAAAPVPFDAKRAMGYLD